VYDGEVEFQASVIELGDLGGGNAEENEVVYPFGDGANPLGSEDVCANVRKVAIEAG